MTWLFYEDLFYLSKRWQDEILQWDPKEFGDVDMIRIPADKIWTPDIVLYNK